MTDDLVKRLRHQADEARKNYPEVFRISEEIAYEAADRIEKLEAALLEIAKTVIIEDESWHPSYHDFSFTQVQTEGLSKALAARLLIARKALEEENANSN